MPKSTDGKYDGAGILDPETLPNRIKGPEDFFPKEYDGQGIPDPRQLRHDAASLSSDNGGE